MSYLTGDGTRWNPYVKWAPDVPELYKYDRKLVWFTDGRYPDNQRYEFLYVYKEEFVTGDRAYPEVLDTVGDMIFNTIFGILDGMIESATGGIVTDYTATADTVESFAERTSKNVADYAVKLTEDVAMRLNKSIAESSNRSSEAFSDFLGIVRTQQETEDKLFRFIDEAFDIETIEAKREAERLKAESEDATELFRGLALQLQSDKSYLSELEIDRLTRDLKEHELAAFNRSIGVFAVTTKEMQEDARRLQLAAERGSVLALEAGVAVMDAKMVSINHTLLQGFAIPIAQAEGTLWAMQQANTVELSSLRDLAKMQLFVQLKLADDMQRSGLPPLEYLESEES